MIRMRGKQIKVCHFLNYCDRGGTVDMIISLMKRSKHKHTYLTFKATEERKKEFKIAGLKLIEFGEDSGSESDVINYVKHNCDILHAANSGGPEPGVHIGITAGKPTIETCQSPSLPSGSMFENVHVVPVSRGILGYWPKTTKYDRVIYSCSEEIPIISQTESKMYFGLNPYEPVVGRVGRLEGIKRPYDFMQAAQLMHQWMPNLQFLLVGDGNDGEGLRKYAEALAAVGVNIVMPGHLMDRAKSMAYNAIDVFCYPTSMEGFGCVFAEAMSIEKPIITYSDPVNVDIVRDAGVYVIDNVFTNAPEPYYSLAHLTLDVLNNRREYDKLADRARKRYLEYFTPEIMTEKYDKLYEEIA